jgi:spore maturation protein SpmA
MSKVTVDIAIGLIGVLSFWLGMMKVAEQAGIIEKIAHYISPLFSRLMPEIPDKHPAIGSMTMNLSANFLGLDNAATPLGLKAMQDLQSINPKKDTASNAQNFIFSTQYFVNYSVSCDCVCLSSATRSS